MALTRFELARFALIKLAWAAVKARALPDARLADPRLELIMFAETILARVPTVTEVILACAETLRVATLPVRMLADRKLPDRILADAIFASVPTVTELILA